jgi:hypothetical protein
VYAIDIKGDKLDYNISSKIILSAKEISIFELLGNNRVVYLKVNLFLAVLLINFKEYTLSSI